MDTKYLLRSQTSELTTHLIVTENTLQFSATVSICLQCRT